MTTGDSPKTDKTMSIEHFTGLGLSDSAATTAVSIYQNLGSRDLALPDQTIAEIAEFYELDARKGIRVATLLGSVALVETVASFEENDYLDYLLAKFEAVGLGHITEDQDQLRDFASELGIDLSYGLEYGLKNLLDKISLMSREELVEIAESIGIFADEVMGDEEDTETEEFLDFDDEEDGDDEGFVPPSFVITDDMDEEFDSYLEAAGKKFTDDEEDEDEDQPEVIVDEDEEWVIE